MIAKNEIPILEFSDCRSAVITPAPLFKAPEKCLMTFFGEVLDEFTEKSGARMIGEYVSEMRNFPVYTVVIGGEKIALTQASVGGSSAAMQADFLYGLGVRTLFCCGSCGALDNIPAGDVIVPYRALRADGASYFYLPPSRFVDLDADMVAAAESVLRKHSVPFVRTVAWTTAGFYRETAEMVEYRKSEGCGAVEMECASLAALCRFRGMRFGQLLYSGDILCDTDNYDDRDWYGNRSARELLFDLSLETLIGI